MHMVLANPGDRTDNAPIEWGADHRRIDGGTLMLTGAVPETQGNCRDIARDPQTPRGSECGGQFIVD